MAANARGQRITLAELKTMAGMTDDGTRSIAANINKSYQLFLPPTPSFADSLGWVAQQADENDQRKKYLVLTEAGREIATKMAAAFSGGE